MTSFIENHTDQIVKKDSTFFTKPQSLKFDQSHHKSLNSELKYLYTAITRVKCNLWIFDSDEEKRLPIFHYWEKNDLVEIRGNKYDRSLQTHTCLVEDDQKYSVKSCKKDDQGPSSNEDEKSPPISSKEEWKSQGDYYKRKKLWEPAMKCFQKAECSHLESEARAYSLAQQARTPGLRQIEITELYLQSAHAFLKCDQFQHDYQSLVNAAKCLKKAKRREESAKLYLYLGEVID